MIGKPVSALTGADIQALVGLPESRTLEFKRDLNFGKDEERREFLADVSSFANAQGGDIVFGVEMAAGIATAVPGISLSDADKTMQQLEGIIRDGLEPRLPVEMSWIDGETGRGFMVIRVRPSLAGPHRVKFREHAKFYGRNSGGKYPMDVHELRTAFAATAGVERRIKEIQAQTVEALEGNVLPVSFTTDPYVAVSYIPLASLFSRYDLVVDPNFAMVPLDSYGMNSYPTMDGVVTYAPNSEGIAYAASLTNRAGHISCWTTLPIQEQINAIFAGSVESRVLRAARGGRMALDNLGVSGPAAITVSLLRVGGFCLHNGSPMFPGLREPLRLKLGSLHLPPIVIDTPNEDALVPLCERLWNAFGLYRPAGRAVGAES